MEKADTERSQDSVVTFGRPDGGQENRARRFSEYRRPPGVALRSWSAYKPSPFGENPGLERLWPRPVNSRGSPPAAGAMNNADSVSVDIISLRLITAAKTTDFPSGAPTAGRLCGPPLHTRPRE